MPCPSRNNGGSPALLRVRRNRVRLRNSTRSGWPLSMKHQEKTPATTIAAIATAPGPGGIGIVRISGPAVRTIATSMLGRLPRPRHAQFTPFFDHAHQPIDQGLALFFPTPHSFTGEDVLELHAHGGPVVLDLLLRRAIASGARLARPGEFSERAFLHGKLDLVQAEAVADLIASGSESAARSAMRSLQGVFSEQVHQLVEDLIHVRMFVESAIDFPEEEIDFLAEQELRARLQGLQEQIAALLEAAKQGCLLHEGATVVLVGRPNAGKSSLLNALAQTDAAIVSDIPGTTRDLLREQIQIDGLPLHIIDTAGLRPARDAIESEGVRRAQVAMTRANHALVLMDDTLSGSAAAELLTELPAGVAHTLVYNKIDLTGRAPGLIKTGSGAAIALSAKTGAGLDALRQHLKKVMGFEAAGEVTFMARRRHLDAIRRAQAHVETGVDRLQQARAGELLAEELRLAQQALGEITGEFTPDDLLGRIFSSFCI